MKDMIPRRTSPAQNIAYQQENSQVESEDVHLRDYLEILIKRRRIVISFFVLLSILGFCSIFPTTPKYSATAILKIEPQSPLGTVGEAVNNIQYSSGDGYDYYKTQFALLQSRPLAKRVVTDLRLGSNPAFLRDNPPSYLNQILFVLELWIRAALSPISAWLTPSVQSENQAAPALDDADTAELEIQGLIGRYLEFLRVDPVRETRLVRVEFITSDPQLSRMLANAHAAAFIHSAIETRFELTQEARDFLEKKLAEIKARVERSERELDKFRSQHGVVSLEGSDNVVANRMLDLNRRLIEARDKRIEVESLYYALKDKNAQNLSKIIDNTRIQSLKARLDNLEVDNARLSLMFKPDHPSLQELNKQIAETRQRLDKEISTVQRGIESDYKIARTREETLEAATNREQEAALNLKRIGVSYTILDQEAKVNRVLFERLLQRLNETNISNSTTVSNIAVAEEAFAPDEPMPSAAKRKLMVFSAFGLILGGGLAFVVEYFSSVAETPERVWQVARVPTLGVVPHIRSLQQTSSVFQRLINSSARHQLGETDDTQAKELILFHQPLSVFPESYRSIRTSLLYSRNNPPPQVILVTSAHPDEGKTVTAVNLSISLAQNDYNVLIIDADMRKGNCHSLLQTDARNGLSSVLSEQQALDACIRSTSVRRLSLLSRGEIPPNPIELLSSLQMKEGLANLRNRFDFILIDSPPALVVSDASVLATFCDGVLLVINAEKTTLPMIQLLRERMDTVCANIIGVVLNAANLRNPKYSYYRTYYKSYPETTPEYGTASPSEKV